MKWHRCSILIPGASISTTKALIFFDSGCRAITTMRSAMVPLVHQSFSPFMT